MPDHAHSHEDFVHDTRHEQEPDRRDGAGQAEANREPNASALAVGSDEERDAEIATY